MSYIGEVYDQSGEKKYETETFQTPQLAWWCCLGMFEHYGGRGRMVVRQSDAPPKILVCKSDHRHSFVDGYPCKTCKEDVDRELSKGLPNRPRY